MLETIVDLEADEEADDDKFDVAKNRYSRAPEGAAPLPGVDLINPFTLCAKLLRSEPNFYTLKSFSKVRRRT